MFGENQFIKKQAINHTLFCHKVAFCLQSCVCAACLCALHPWKDALLPVSSSSQCCSGLASCIYLKALQRECRSFASVCKCQIFKMQRIYMHSNEHFEVFTTVLAPQGEWDHSCSEVWRGMLLLMMPTRARFHISIRGPYADPCVFHSL